MRGNRGEASRLYNRTKFRVGVLEYVEPVLRSRAEELLELNPDQFVQTARYYFRPRFPRLSGPT